MDPDQHTRTEEDDLSTRLSEIESRCADYEERLAALEEVVPFTLDEDE